MLDQEIRIGTRGSALALWQANYIKQALVHAFPQLSVVIHVIQTQGDKDAQCSIADMGGKGVFVKDIEQALVDNTIDIAVHSFKDITAQPHAALDYAGFCLQERVTDAIILFNHSVEALALEPLVLATGSMRRQALCKEYFSKVQCVSIRGNIDTRIQRARDRGLDGLILSTAGLQRLGLDDYITHEPDPMQFVPAPGQGLLALQVRAQDIQVTEYIQAITQVGTNDLGHLYYDLLEGIAFNCGIPFGAYIDKAILHVFLQDVTGVSQAFSVENIAENMPYAIQKIKEIQHVQ
jgi:hydroxymethylbilane synthase